MRSSPNATKENLVGGTFTAALALPLDTPHLTHREADVLELIAAGFSSELAGRCLRVSPKDIEYHVSSLITKFAANSRAGVVGRAFVLGYLDSRLWPPRVRRRSDRG